MHYGCKNRNIYTKNTLYLRVYLFIQILLFYSKHIKFLLYHIVSHGATEVSISTLQTV